MNRRDFLTSCCSGMGGLALSSLLSSAARAQERKAVEIDPMRPLSLRTPHFKPRAKRVIFLYQYGGPSQVDMWDYKPLLTELHGKPVPAAIRAKKDKVGGVFGACHDKLMAGPWTRKRHGESGSWASDLVRATAAYADDLCLVRSMQAESSNHAPATYQMNTGVILPGKPSLGSWLTYGLGSENQNLPGYVLLFKVAGLGGSAKWSNAFLPAAFQGTQFRDPVAPVLDLDPPADLGDVQRSTIDIIQRFNKTHSRARPGLPDRDGRIASYELAYRMQSEALNVGDLATETKQTQDMYGIEDKNKDKALFGRMCLLSRRLVEKGVRFVQLYNAVDKNGWDAH